MRILTTNPPKNGRSRIAVQILYSALLPLFLLLRITPSLATERPNIVMIVLDDAGYSDLGVYGGEIDTPQIDLLAKQGMLFSQFHVTPNCSSTRASLLTGMDHHRTGLGTHGGLAENQKEKPGYEGHLNKKVVTVAKVLQTAGYRTMMAGKWHLGKKDPSAWPVGRGFDDSFALLNGGASHWDLTPLFPSTPSVYVADNKVVEKLPDDFYSSDYFTDRIIKFMKASERPFFAYLSFTAPHNPLHAPEELVQKYKDYYKDGWDDLHLSRLKRLKAKGLIAENVNPQPRPSWIPPWDRLDNKAKNNATRDMAVYAAMIDRVDQNIGRVVSSLKAQGRYDDTLILVFSDNGPSKTTIADYLSIANIDAEFLESFDNSLGNRGQPTSNVDLGPGWAYGLAAPFRLMKGYQSQGGVLSPLVVKPPADWPQNNPLIKTPVHVMDIMPTLLKVGLATHPASSPGDAILAMQGKSMVNLMKGGDGRGFSKRGFGGELFGIRAYRLGDWKILKLPPPYGTGEWQLYDLASDPGETIDLADNRPERLKTLAKSWQSYASVNGVVEPNKLTFYTKPPKKL